MTTTSPPLSDQARATLLALIKAAYPHDGVPDGPYERTADAVVEKVSGPGGVWQQAALVAGLESLDAKVDGGFAAYAAKDPDGAAKVLHEIAGAPFFGLIRGVAVVALYDDEETWGVLGYEGSSFEKGGYINRGFDDLDWLPAARITEYDGPDQLVEVAPDDEPKEG